MAEESDDEERTEEPTSRRLTQARERGDLPRSQDFPGSMILLFVAGMLFLSGYEIFGNLSTLLISSLTFSWDSLPTPEELSLRFGQIVLSGFWSVRWIFLGCVAVALISMIFNGGYNFSPKAAGLQFNKLNPLNGLKRMFGTQAIANLSKNLLKFVIILAAIVYIIWSRRAEILGSYGASLERMIVNGTRLALEIFLLVTLVGAVFALLDVPYQRWKFYKKLRMTKKEIRDEMKDMEGRPEVRRLIRRRQRELGRARMMDKIKDADVVIVNPTEFAVALSYDESKHSVPVVVAKGKGEIAASIKRMAGKHGVPEVSAPSLARAIYFTTDLDAVIPEPLYRAVAAVLAFVFRTSAIAPGLERASAPNPDVPLEFQFDEDGVQLSSRGKDA